MKIVYTKNGKGITEEKIKEENLLDIVGDEIVVHINECIDLKESLIPKINNVGYWISKEVEVFYCKNDYYKHLVIVRNINKVLDVFTMSIFDTKLECFINDKPNIVSYISTTFKDELLSNLPFSEEEKTSISTNINTIISIRTEKEKEKVQVQEKMDSTNKLIVDGIEYKNISKLHEAYPNIPYPTLVKKLKRMSAEEAVKSCK